MSRSRLQRAFILRSALRLYEPQTADFGIGFHRGAAISKMRRIGRVLIGVVKPFGLRLADGGKSGDGEKREILPDILVVARRRSI